MIGVSLKGTGSGPLPPMLEQYIALRDRHPEFLLLFQVGEFYETFGEDAERLARALGIALTHKTSKDFTTPMAGIPMRAADGHIERLLKQGYRVAVAEQVEDPSAVQGLVEREVIQLITPGTVTSEAILRSDENYLAALATGDGYGLAFLDVSTGEFRCCLMASKSAVSDELMRYRPSEVLLAPELMANEALTLEFAMRFPVMRSSAPFEIAEARSWLERQFGTVPISCDAEAIVRACGAVLGYVAGTRPELIARETVELPVPAVRRLERFDPGAMMRLDETALAALEIFEPLNRLRPREEDHPQTLFESIYCTRTAAGKRRLRAWLRSPLLEVSLIESRLDALEALCRDAVTRQAVRAALHRAHDLERLAARVASSTASPRDLAALVRTLELVPELRLALEAVCSDLTDARLLRDLAQRLDAVSEVIELVGTALVEAPPLRLGDGGLIREGFDPLLDAHRREALEGRAWIAGLEESERLRTGITNLKVGFNSVFGYYLEVTNAHKAKVPDDYRPLQSLKDRARFTRPDLRERERIVLHAEDRARVRELEVFAELRSGLKAFTERLQRLSSALADLDVISSFAEVAAIRGYVRPQFSSDGVFEIEQGRHIVVELSGESNFVPNDLLLSKNKRMALVTGPNMSGKSTYLRQAALIALLAQIGSFVPARRAVTRVFDRIFTRIGASDDLAGGASTFMVEMRELATILHDATEQSLVVLDEIGRGTSTFDGLALAYSATEFLHELGAFGLCATHYFELTKLETELPGLYNLHVAAQEEVGGLTFYHQVMSGPASRSYGVQVARLAGLPPAVTRRAEVILSALEQKANEQLDPLLCELLSLDLARLTPIEALAKLETWQRQLRGTHEVLA